MGRLIDCNDVYNAIQITTDNFGVAKHVVETNMLTMLSKIETVEAIPKADYENRLKADMSAMLKELKKSIEDKVYNVSAYSECLDCDVVDYEDVNEIIIEKINSLKGQQDRNE